MRGIILLVLLGVVLAGCANKNVWFKQGASTNDFEADKYTCLQQSQQNAGRAVVDQSGGNAQTGVITNWGLYNSCMQAHGWHSQDRESTNRAIAQQNEDLDQKKTDFRSAMNGFGDRIAATCTKPEYAPLFLKTPCNGKDINFEQLADSTKITPEQKAVLPRFRTEIDSISKEQREYVRTHPVVSNLEKQWADYLDSIQSDIEKYNLDLYKGVISWGEYNQLRKDLTAKTMAEQRRIYSPARQ